MLEYNGDITLSKNILYQPIWNFYKFDNIKSNAFEPDCMIVPQKESRVLRQIDIEPDTVLIELDNLDSIKRVEDFCSLKSNPHIAFCSQSQWDEPNASKHHELFLQLLKSLKKLSTFQLSIIIVDCLPGPNHEPVTNPLDVVYLGLGKTFAKETPQATIRCVHTNQLSRRMLAKIDTLPSDPNILSPIYLSKEGYSYKTLKPIRAKGTPDKKGFKQHGTYIIFGGTGGLGSLLAGYLLKQYNAKVILVSRSQPNPELRLQFNHLNVTFEQMDLLNEHDVTALINRYPNINGIIHSALVLDDSSVMTMTPEKLQSVLSPKVQGSINIVKAMAHRHCDFMLFFSSIQSFLANAGQGNYTAACLTKDAIACMIENALNIKTHIINWGYWGGIGIVANDFYRSRMQQQEIGSITPEEGLALIEQCLQENLSQVVMVKGSDNALKNMGIDSQVNLDKPASNQKLLANFDESNPAVQYNKTMMDMLDSYTKHQYHQLSITSEVIPRFLRLKEALSSIKYQFAPSHQEIINQFPELKAHLNLIDICLKNLNDILTGKTCPLSVMFPNGSFAMVEPVYRNNPVANYYNERMADAVEQYVNDAAHNGQTIRILEIGAGTGSTTEKVLPRLKNKNVHYTYTDLSHAFLNKGRQEFSAFPFMDYKILNIASDIDESTVYDVIIATNVIHATSDIVKSTANLSKLLRSTGVLLLNEITSRQDFATLTFGLTDGWWLSEDQYRVPYSPLLSIESWENVLTRAGFVACYNHGGYGQYVIEAHKEALTQPNAEPVSTTKTSTDSAYQWLTSIFATVMHMSPEDIQPDIPFSDYGIDSLISLEIIKPMSEKVGYLPATILFEYPTMSSLSGYFVTHYPETFADNAPPAMPIKDNVDTNDNTDNIISIIQQTIASVLHMSKEEVLVDQVFNDMGIDSLISMEIVNQLQAKLGYLPATVLFEYQSVRQLAAFIHDNNPQVSTPKEMPVEVATEQTVSSATGDIAIIGMSGILPESKTIDEFWTLLSNGNDAFRPISTHRFNVSKDGKTYTQTAALINNVDGFDNEFFKIAPIDAEQMDPQERLFLQTTYHAIEDAGLNVSKLRGENVGCYVGVMNHGYSMIPVDRNSHSKPHSLYWSIANRASYKFDWHGPSFAVDSACSSSLTALHTAVNALKNNDCDMAVVGGVNIVSHPSQIETLCQLHMLSPTDQCKPFGQNADGFVDGEGIISLVLMPYEKAQSQNLNIYATICASHLNAGGQANGYSAPNPKAQAALIKKTLEKANVSPDQIDYVEAHGTGTELGDPIEIKALTEAYANCQKASIPIGSVKGNIGHLESAAGLASVVKVVLQMKHQQIAPSLHSQVENPHLTLCNTPFYVNKGLSHWHTTKNRLHAAISSFGAGGANAHVIIASEPSKAEKTVHEQSHYYFPISAHSKNALAKELAQLHNRLIKDPTQLASLSYGYCCVRTPQKHRLGLVVRSRDELLAHCQKPLSQLTNLTQRQTDPLMQAFNQGQNVDFGNVFSSMPRAQLLPYPFDDHKHWVDSTDSNFGKKEFITAQHVILDEAIAPAALSISMFYDHAPFQSLNQVLWQNIMKYPIKTKVSLDDSNYIASDLDAKVIYSKATLGSASMIESDPMLHHDKPFTKHFSQKEVYQFFNDKGYQYGPDFQCIQQAYVKDNHVHALLSVSQDFGYQLPPNLIDSALQSAILTELDNAGHSGLKVPFMIESIIIHKLPTLNSPIYCDCITRGNQNKASCTCDIFLMDSDGKPLITLKGVISIKSTSEKLFQTATKEEPNIKFVSLN